MNDRPTPETDAAWLPQSGNGLNEVKEISRKLERERDEAREGQMEALCDFQLLARKIDDIRDVFDHQDEDWTGSIPLADAVSKVIRERDEAREDTPWHANGETKDEWFARQREKYAVIERERDEAREAFAVATDQLFKEQSDHRMVVNSYCAVIKERNQLRKALATVSEDCLAWLNSESDEPSVEFIKAVQNFAHKESNAPLEEAVK